ncbi:MAG: hypothetical protein JW726_15545 [Anaerolineales bacterium]|nr:hypothetical protein [Anaerolineales bacterium]
MIQKLTPVRIIIIGFILVLLGFVLPLLMVLRWVESSFLLSFISYTASVLGLFLGLVGAAWYVKMR